MRARAPGPERLQAAIDLVVARLQPENIQTVKADLGKRIDDFMADLGKRIDDLGARIAR